MTTKQRLLLPVLIGVSLLAAVFTLISFCAEGQDGGASLPAKQPINVRLTGSAWVAFDGSNYAEAIADADECIDRFQGQADLLQASLVAKHVTLSSGTVADIGQRNQIFANGLLNDVATCFFIKGYAEERLQRNDEARKAYEAAKTYPLARAWDKDSDTFWLPSDAAAGRLETLGK